MIYVNLDTERVRRGYTEEYVAQKLGMTPREYRRRFTTGSFLESDILRLIALYKKSFEYLFEK